jgi:sugar phosphate isomerase/epimerase
MLLSTTTCLLDVKFGYKRAIEIIAKAGFDAVDISMTSLEKDNFFFANDNYMEKAKELLEVANKNNIVFNQAHAYYPTSFLEEEKTKEAFVNVKKGIEIAGFLGAKVIVVHPMQHLHYVDKNNSEILKQMNYEFYSSLMPLAEKNNIIIATENMWQINYSTKIIIDSVCSRGPEFCEYVDMIKSPNFGACLDIGHCGLVGQKAEDIIRQLGSERLVALHIHDNNGKSDSHVEPLSALAGDVNWEEVTKALAEIGFKGDFTFESENLFKYINEETVDAAAKYLHDIGRMLIRKIENYKI